jgi:membrane-associated phospholipid phosphatase
MQALWDWGISVIVAVQGLAWLAPGMTVVTQLGTEEFFLLLMPALYWCYNAGLGRRLAVLLIVSDGLNDLLKVAFHQPRPYWVDGRVQSLSHETSYGIPSAHAQHAVAVWGFLAGAAAPARRALAGGLAGALIALISFSRIYLGQHFPGDVLGGLLAGGLALWAYRRWEAPAAAWLSRLGLWQQLGVALAVSLAFLILVLGTLAVVNRTPDPVEWERQAALALAGKLEAGEPATDPRNPESAVATAGMLLGLGAGLAGQRRWARFDAGGAWGKRLLRYLIGVIGVLVFWRGLALVFPSEPLAIAMVFRYGRYALVVYWALFLAPLVFLRLRLAERRKA